MGPQESGGGLLDTRPGLDRGLVDGEGGAKVRSVGVIHGGQWVAFDEGIDVPLCEEVDNSVQLEDKLHGLLLHEGRDVLHEPRLVSR